ncbi:MAG: MBL fold metallo-hydrolase [Bacteroidales bacterium]|jgi:L-ascorbate metabolism protein UlaG (beta-lactamase superfamily)|nr:MBL fold metallo-hydrolase [Bacteroidales bacterium]
MKTYALLIIALISFNLNAQHMETIEKMTWYGQAAVKIDNDGQLIFIDPYQLTTDEKADLILITHSHGDHLSFPDIERIADEQTKFVCPYDCAEQLKEAGYKNVTPVSPHEKVDIDGTEIISVPMYNIVKTQYHPKENNWTGFIINVGGTRIYHAGDTERIPEMKKVECDIVMLPLGQVYTMNSVEEAAEAAMDTGAEIAIPIHYGMYEGSAEDAKQFKQLLEDKIEVVILTQTK